MIGTAEQTPSATHDCRIALNPYWTKMFDFYYGYIRASIFKKKNMTHEFFFIQYDGKPFKKVSDGIVKLQKQYKVAKITSGTARIAIQTYTQSLPPAKQFADFIGKAKKP
ncbi:hypothetical protein DPMN_131258 [Dreissena polymorpha]|uniref:Uncharacterized protein n=1 Tax=Dreissena polymorpha TaxID=45954 RepID=A0A9D4K293_DREPO|nr:hypothetical protein DPMN_131258 [Dreissena polymorpha]